MTTHPSRPYEELRVQALAFALTACGPDCSKDLILSYATAFFAFVLPTDAPSVA